MSNWLQSLFRTRKPIIGMCHLRALPGDPRYETKSGMRVIIDAARADLRALAEGGVDGVMFSNEFSTPYMLKVEPIVAVAMARVIGEVVADLSIPYGVNVLWDGAATVELAVAVEAQFVREIFSGVYASDFGLWNPNAGEVARLRDRLGGNDIRMIYNIAPESARYLGDRALDEIARSTVFNCQPDAICVSGLIAGAETSLEALRVVKQAVPDTPLFANTGVRADTVAEQFAVADGAIVGTAFKVDGSLWNPVDLERVMNFMQAARDAR
jgi:membrane complex biogenesis BtpA family protein